MEKNELFITEITDMTAEGEGIGRAGAFPFFIKDTCIGDTALCRVTKLKKNYGYARLEELQEASPFRAEAPCRISRSCGGCQIQQMTYQAQLDFKTEKVRQNLIRIGGLEAPEVLKCLGMEEPFRYRNKAQIPFGTDKEGKITAGFYARRTHSIIPQEDCLITFREAGDIVRLVKQWMTDHKVRPYDETTGQGLIRHVLIRKGFRTGEIMVCLIANGEKVPSADSLTASLESIEGFMTLCLNTNTKCGNTILGSKTVPLYGPGVIRDYIGDVLFEISANSFFQVNPEQTQVLYQTALDYAGLCGNETVFDLYCGIGTISLFLAGKAKHVYGIEIVPQAIEDAKRNAALNGLSNVDFYTGKAEEILPAWYKEHPEEKIDVIVMDPPRKGCDAEVLKTVTAMEPRRIVYVSCDSATLARDLKILCEEGYQLEKVQPVDMFPMTVGVEAVACLNRIM